MPFYIFRRWKIYRLGYFFYMLLDNHSLCPRLRFSNYWKMKGFSFNSHLMFHDDELLLILTLALLYFYQHFTLIKWGTTTQSLACGIIEDRWPVIENHDLIFSLSSKEYDFVGDRSQILTHISSSTSSHSNNKIFKI